MADEIKNTEEVAAEVIETAVVATNESTENVQTEEKDTFDSIKEKAEEIKERANEFKEKATEKFDELQLKGKEKMEEIKEIVTEKIDELAEAAKEKINKLL